MSRSALQLRSFPTIARSLRPLARRCGGSVSLLEGLESRVLLSVAPQGGSHVEHRVKHHVKAGHFSGAANHAPTEAWTGLIAGKVKQGAATTISYGAVVAAAHAKDADGNPITFTIETVSDAGTLTITHGGTTSAVVAGTTVFADGDTLSWTPKAGRGGRRYALSVLASDGTASAAHQAALFATVAELPRVVVNARRGEASSSKPGAIVVTRCGDLSSAVTVNFATATGTGFGKQGTDYVLKDSAGDILTNSITLAAGQRCAVISVYAVDDGATGKLRAKLNVVAGDGYTVNHGCSSTAVVRLVIGAAPPTTTPTDPTPPTPPADPLPPTVANAAVSTSIDFGTSLTLTFDQLVAMTGAALGANDTSPLQLKITDEVAGVLKIEHGGSAAVGANIGDLVSAGDTLVWTPPTGAISNGISAFSVVAHSGSLDSSGTSDFSVGITINV
ncbi:MAG: hypothetical protein ACTHN5_03825 [Phycisphaerae bacterium]